MKLFHTSKKAVSNLKGYLMPKVKIFNLIYKDLNKNEIYISPSIKPVVVNTDKFINMVTFFYLTF
jgi:hypothetical protein